VTILITGLGFIGSALAKRLLEHGEQVVALENFFSTPRDSIAPLCQSGLRLIEGSITDADALTRAFAEDRVETVFHLAAQASAHPDAASIEYTQTTNFTGPRMLLDACVAHGVRRVVLASSMRLYRAPLPRHVTEDCPLAPPDLVHLSQLYGELMLRAYLPLGISGAAARLGIVHGVSPVMKTDPRYLAVPHRFCLQAAKSEPLVARTGIDTLHGFVHIDDAVDGLLRLRDVSVELRVANVAAEVLSVSDVARFVQRAGSMRGLDIRIQHDGRLRRYAPRVVASALNATGFHAERYLEEHIGDVLDYYIAYSDEFSGDSS
jgi:nucleoside-diphosphate-sugar epimerase